MNADLVDKSSGDNSENKGVLRVSETAKAEIEATRAFVMIAVASEKLAFGNAAIAASTDLRAAIEKIKQVDSSIEVETEAVSTKSSDNLLGKSSAATYTLKLTVSDISKLGNILGICAEGKKISVKSILWDYDEEEIKRQLIKEAVQKAKQKADDMMAVIDYKVVGIRSCSDSYSTPAMGETLPGHSASRTQSYPVGGLRSKSASAGKSVDIGTQFICKKKITATCTAEFFVQAV